MARYSQIDLHFLKLFLQRNTQNDSFSLKGLFMQLPTFLSDLT